MDTSSFRHALRGLLRNPGFTAIAILTLGLGIGANTAVFSLVSSILIHPLPYPEAERLVGLWHAAPGVGFPIIDQSDATYLNYCDHSKSFEDMALLETGFRNLTNGGEPERIEVAFATASLFTVLRAEPSPGRGFTEEEDQPGAEPVSVLSHSLWTRRFGADPSVVGKTIHLNGVATRVVGVMPASFVYPRASTQLWLPIQLDRARYSDTSFSYKGIGRLRAGVSLEEAVAEMAPILAGVATMEQILDRSTARTTVTMVLLGLSAVVATLLGSVGIYGVVSYLVSQRRNEIGIRMALGAGGQDVERMFLLNGLKTAIAGTALGLAASFALTRVLGSLLFQVQPFDPATHVVAAVAILGIAVLASALPARRAARVDPVVALRGE